MSEQENVNEEELESLDAEAEEQEEEQEDTAVKDAFEAGISEDSDEDDIKLAMIGAGATFKNVTRLYNQFMIDAGLSLSKEDKAAHVTAALEGKEFADEDGYDDAIASLIDPEKGINERSAGGLLRAYAKKHSVEVYKKPKAEGSGKTGFASTFYNFLISDPKVDKETANKYIMNPENSENVRRHESHYMNIWQLVHDIADPDPVAESA